MASAAGTCDRLFETVGITPSGILAAAETLREAGSSGQRTRYLNETASAFQRVGEP